MDGDVDFLREARQVLAEGIMDAEVSVQIGAQIVLRLSASFCRIGWCE